MDLISFNDPSMGRNSNSDASEFMSMEQDEDMSSPLLSGQSEARDEVRSSTITPFCGPVKPRRSFVHFATGEDPPRDPRECPSEMDPTTPHFTPMDCGFRPSRSGYAGSLGQGLQSIRDPTIPYFTPMDCGFRPSRSGYAGSFGQGPEAVRDPLPPRFPSLTDDLCDSTDQNTRIEKGFHQD